MRRQWLAALVIVIGASPFAFAQRSGAAAAAKSSTLAKCAADLGNGAKTRRHFCDVVIAKTPGGSVSMTIPRHTGAATLRFDLHNRFSPASGAAAGDLFAQHVAVVAVVRSTGAIVDRAAVTGEFRAPGDAFDQITGVKGVAPGAGSSVVVTIPAGVTAIGIVGVRLESTTLSGRQVFDTPGRPVAMISNLRVEYVPAK